MPAQLPANGLATGPEFLATVTHEVRTPLNAVIGMTELLRQMALPPEAASLVETIHMSGEHLLALVNDMLDSARLESGRLQFERVDVLLRDVVEEAVEIAAATSGARRLTIAAVIDPRLPDVVRGDPRRLGQVLANLLGNAVKFTPHGHVALRLTQLAEERAHVVCRLEVEDTGIGMDPADVPRLFEPFTQADDDTARRFGGTGLGLSIAARLVEAMGARIDVETAPGRGSRFRVDLRLERAARRQALALPSCEGVRVALTSDDTLLAESLSAQAERLGAQLDGAEAIDAGGRRPVALVLDPRSPRAEALRARAMVAGLPIVDLLPPGAASRPGGGLHLRLPVRLSALAHVLATLQPHVPRVGGLRPVPSGRVLVVEDHEANQQLVVRVLDSVGVVTDVVATGEEACQAMHRDQYDLVFMDCRLPGMDGLATTRLLRQEARLDRVPIVGLSASVQAGVRQACLAAGMDDFLAKPVRPAALLDALRRWLQPDAASVEVATPPVPGERAGLANRFDPSVQDDLRRLGVLTAIAGAAATELPDRLRDLRAAVAADDLEGLARLGHRLTTSLGNAGWTRAADLASRLEVACSAPRDGDALTLARALEQEVLEGRAQLESLAGRAVPEMPR